MAKRVDLRLHGMHLGRPLAGPETLHIDVTNGCNTNCVTCWDHSPLLHEARPRQWKGMRIDAGAVADLLNDVAELGGLRAVILSGMGEPFTHPDIYEMIAEVKRRGGDTRTLGLFGQELIHVTASIARMNLVLHGVEDFEIATGNTLSNPVFTDRDRLRTFDVFSVALNNTY